MVHLFSGRLNDSIRLMGPLELPLPSEPYSSPPMTPEQEPFRTVGSGVSEVQVLVDRS